MCGIAGALGDFSPALIEQMVGKIAHRGPDNLSWFVQGKLQLGHARLSIVDLSAASNQPMWDATGRLCIVFNGEIYNYQALRAQLLADGYQFNSNGDAEVLLNLYLAYGVELLSKVNGIFSFAIWDNQTGQLWLVRDHFGVKPLYYTFTPSGLLFSSEIKSLLVCPEVKKELDHDALLRTLVFLWSPGPHTILQAVKKLEPGSYLLVNAKGEHSLHTYWNWPEYQPVQQSVEAHSEAVLDSLRQSVSDQLVADVPVGSFLSGGLDSSLIVALASAQAKQPVHCYTIDTGDTDGFEADLPYAQKVAAHLDVPLHVLKVTPDIASLLPKMIYHLDEVQSDPAPINVLLICEMARQQGIKVLLSGAGGDDVYTGYRRHYAQSVEGYWDWLPLPVRKVLKQLTGLLPDSHNVTRRISKAFKYADLAGPERLLSYFFWLDPDVARSLFRPEIKLSARPFDFMLEHIPSDPAIPAVEKMLMLERRYFLVDHNFNYTDKMSMATGVEVRVPFLDHRVVETASRVPVSLKQQGRTGKWILKKAAEQLLPTEVIYRPKSGFGAPLRQWLKTDLAPLVADVLSTEALDKRGIFDAAAVKALVAADLAGEDYSYPIFALVCFELWCRQFLDGADNL